MTDYLKRRVELFGPIEQSAVAAHVRDTWKDGYPAVVVYSTGELVQQRHHGLESLYRMSCGHLVACSFGNRGTVHRCTHASHPVGNPDGRMVVVPLDDDR